MLQSLQIRLETNGREKELLLETMKRYNSAANFLAEKAFELKLANKYALQKLLYHEIRERFHLECPVYSPRDKQGSRGLQTRQVKTAPLQNDRCNPVPTSAISHGRE